MKRFLRRGEPLLRRLQIPFYSFILIFFNPITLGITTAKIILCSYISLIRTFTPPLHRLAHIFSNPVPGFVAKTKKFLSFNIPSLGSLSVIPHIFCRCFLAAAISTHR